MEEEKEIIRNYLRREIKFQIGIGHTINDLNKELMITNAKHKMLHDLQMQKNIILERAYRDFDKFFVGIFRSEKKEHEIKGKENGIIRNFIQKEIKLEISKGININELNKKLIIENAKNKLLMPLQNEQINMNGKIKKQLEQVVEYYDEVAETIFETAVKQIKQKNKGKIAENVYYFNKSRNPNLGDKDPKNNKLQYVPVSNKKKPRYSEGMEM